MNSSIQVLSGELSSSAGRFARLLCSNLALNLSIDTHFEYCRIIATLISWLIINIAFHKILTYRRKKSLELLSDLFTPRLRFKNNDVTNELSSILFTISKLINVKERRNKTVSLGEHISYVKILLLCLMFTLCADVLINSTEIIKLRSRNIRV